MHKKYKFYDSRVIGVKTGSTSVAGKCLITMVEIAKKKYIIVVLGCDDDVQRYGGTAQLIEKIIEKK